MQNVIDNLNAVAILAALVVLFSLFVIVVMIGKHRREKAAQQREKAVKKKRAEDRQARSRYYRDILKIPLAEAMFEMTRARIVNEVDGLRIFNIFSDEDIPLVDQASVLASFLCAESRREGVDTEQLYEDMAHQVMSSIPDKENRNRFLVDVRAKHAKEGDRLASAVHWIEEDLRAVKNEEDQATAMDDGIALVCNIQPLSALARHPSHHEQ